MNIVTVFSTKGGVGKSTLCANLSVALKLLGHPVLALDLDPQNGLRFHFTLEGAQGDGLVAATLEDRPWRDVIQTTASGVGLLPFGVCTETEIESFEDRLASDRAWLSNQLRTLGLGPDTIVMIDTPPGSSLYLRQALAAAQWAFAVINPDAGSYASLPGFKAFLERYCLQRADFKAFGLAINQADPSRRLAKDVYRVLHTSMSGSIIGTVHTDQSISEALACGQSVFQYSPDSEAARDIARCAEWIQEQVGQRGLNG